MQIEPFYANEPRCKKSLIHKHQCHTQLEWNYYHLQRAGVNWSTIYKRFRPHFDHDSSDHSRWMKPMLTLSSLLRSSNSGQLSIPRTKLRTFGDRAFSVAAPTLWNSLPTELRNAPTLDSFKKLLKTHLFHIAFECWMLIILCVCLLCLSLYIAHCKATLGSMKGAI